MPFSVNGIGSGMMPASRQRNVDGFIQFDAIESVMLVFLPIFPYKVIHVVAYQEESYQAIRLRFSWRIVLKAFIHRWCYGAFIMSAGMTLITAVIFFSSTKTPDDPWYTGAAAGGLLLIGTTMLLVYRALDQADDRWRRLFGATPAGTSDPFDWLPVMTENISQGLLQETGCSNLLDASAKLAKTGALAKAAVCVRLAQAKGDGNAALAGEALELLRRQSEASQSR